MSCSNPFYINNTCAGGVPPAHAIDVTPYYNLNELEQVSSNGAINLFLAISTAAMNELSSLVSGAAAGSVYISSVSHPNNHAAELVSPSANVAYANGAGLYLIPKYKGAMGVLRLHKVILHSQTAQTVVVTVEYQTTAHSLTINLTAGANVVPVNISSGQSIKIYSSGFLGLATKTKSSSCGRCDNDENPCASIQTLFNFNPVNGAGQSSGGIDVEYSCGCDSSLLVCKIIDSGLANSFLLAAFKKHYANHLLSTNRVSTATYYSDEGLKILIANSNNEYVLQRESLLNALKANIKSFADGECIICQGGIGIAPKHIL